MTLRKFKSILIQHKVGRNFIHHNSLVELSDEYLQDWDIIDCDEIPQPETEATSDENAAG